VLNHCQQLKKAGWAIAFKTYEKADRFQPKLRKEYIHMSQQAFSAARQKIKWEAFEELFRISVEGSYNEEWETWRGFRVMAVDGSFIQLPTDEALVAYYGGVGQEGTSATALASLLYDVENDIIVDARLEPIERDERSLAEWTLPQQVDSIKRGWLSKTHEAQDSQVLDAYEYGYNTTRYT
jgi:hypothetical protein